LVESSAMPVYLMELGFLALRLSVKNQERIILIRCQ
jgi:hypothetical protein